MIHGGQLVARQLRAEGVDHLFTLTGNHISPIYDGCAKERGPSLVDFRHEQAAVFAADAYARLTRRPGVAAVTAGPGVTNAVTGVAHAAANHSPLILLGGRTPLVLQEMGSLQECPQVEILKPLCRHAVSVFDVTRIPDLLHQAFAHATTLQGGPAFVEFPLDVLMTQVGARDVESCSGRRLTHHSGADPDAVIAAAHALAEAERPVVVVGTGAHWARAEDHLASLVTEFGAPIYCSGLARGLIQPSHRAYFKLSRKAALKDCDVLLVLGAEWDFRLGYGTEDAVNPRARVIQVHPDPARLGKNRALALGICADVRTFLRQLLDIGVRPKAPSVATWSAELRKLERTLRAELASLAEASTRSIHPMHVFHALGSELGNEATVVADGGDFASIAAKAIDPTRPCRWLDPGPFGCIGFGMPAAIAATLAVHDQPVVGLFGDGAFGFNGFELDTAVRQRRRFVAIVGNDGAWGEMRIAHSQLFPGSDVPNIQFLSQETRYDRIAAGFGAHGERVTRVDELGPAIRRALDVDGPALIDVVLDPSYRRKSAVRRPRKRTAAAA